jgi:hypothetical protein
VGNTSHPILLIGNRWDKGSLSRLLSDISFSHDPVTPLWNARKMAKGFKDAAVLHQKSAGHCSLSAASLCTAKVIRDYFRHGTLPESDTECEIESRMFGDSAVRALSAEDAELLAAVQELNEGFEVPLML